MLHSPLALAFRALLLLFALFLLTSCQSFVTGALDLDGDQLSVDEIAQHSMLSIYRASADGVLQFGASGVYYQPSDQPYVITAAHVPMLGSVVHFMTGRMYACDADGYRPRSSDECAVMIAENSIINLDRDTAIIPLSRALPNAHSPEVTWGASLRAGQPVVMASNPAGHPSLVHGRVSWPASDTHFTIDISLWTGSSGGGIYDSQGHLIGLMSGFISKRPLWAPNIDGDLMVPSLGVAVRLPVSLRDNLYAMHDESLQEAADFLEPQDRPRAVEG